MVAKLGISKKDAVVAVETVFEEIKTALKEDDSVEVSGFGKFSVKHKEARTGINPATKESMTIPAKNVPTFKPSKTFKDSL